MPAHLPQASSSQLLKQSNTRCLHPCQLRRLGDVIWEARDAADDFVHQEVGTPSVKRNQFSITNFPLKKALDIDVRPNWSYRVIVTLSFSS